MLDESQYLWDGDDWEAFCFGLLQDRHQAQFVQKVPSNHRGDFGIDYYCLKDATVYQCYAPAGTISIAARALKHRDKITTDLRKLCENKSDLQILFGDVKIECWHLLVPNHDSSDVNKHLTAKGMEVRQKKVPYISDSFEAFISDLSGFDAESMAARISARQSIEIHRERATEQDLISFKTASGPLVDNLDRKLKKRAAAGGFPLNGRRERYIASFLERDNALERLRIALPDVHEKVRSVIDRHTEILEMLGSDPGHGAPQLLSGAVQQLQDDIQSALPKLTPESAQALSIGTVSEWLLRCPLDFPPSTMSVDLITDLDGPFRLQRRPIPMAGDLRIGWGVSIVLLILSYSWGQKSSFKRLHFIGSAIRTDQGRDLVIALLGPADRKPIPSTRVEPWLNRAVNFAHGLGYVCVNNGKTISTTPSGKLFIKSLESNPSTFEVEKEFLSHIRSTAREKDIDAAMLIERLT